MQIPLELAFVGMDTPEWAKDDIQARVDKLNLPSYTAFVMPKLTPVVDASGTITDVTISYPMDLASQMLEFSGVRK